MSHISAPFVVGLTGGIGSGKSTVATIFERMGVFVIDADAQSHALTQPNGLAIAAVNHAFPGVVTDGVLDRARLRSVVFEQPSERTKLEAILHPMIREATRAALVSPAAANAPYVIHMVPLLFESQGYADRVACSVVVDVDETTQIERVTRIRGLPLATVKQIIASQMSRADRLLRTQFVIDNSGPESALLAQVEKLHQVFLASASHRLWQAHPDEARAA